MRRRDFLSAALAAPILAVPLRAARRGERILVRSRGELEHATSRARPGDVVEMADGEWVDAHIRFAANATAERPITLRAQTPGRVRLTGTSYLRFGGPHLVVEGLHFVRRQAVDSREPVVAFESDHGRLLDTAIESYNPPDFDTRYHWVRFSGSRNVVERCLFAGKSHQGPVVALDWPARHNVVRYCHFRDMTHVSANGREIIQALGYGSSEELGDDGAYMLIEHNLFERAHGEGAEIISLKSNRNVVRFNTIRETRGGIVNRSGNFNRIEGNIILGGRWPGTSGIRISGQHHEVVCNYVADVEGPALNLYAGEHFVDERGGIARLTPDFAPILREGTQYGAVPAYAQVKHGLFAFNTFVSDGGPVVVVGDAYRSGWPARQRVLLPEENRIVENEIHTRGPAEATIRVQEADAVPPLDRFSFAPNEIQDNSVHTAGAAPPPEPGRTLTAGDVGPTWYPGVHGRDAAR